jgi:ribonucleoside-diphosphate reductase alpha chain
MKLSENAIKVLESRYLLKNAKGKLIENPKQLFRRVSEHIAKAELTYGKAKDSKKWEKLFYKDLIELKFLPNSPTLMNAGTTNGQLSACFVLPIDDSIKDIFTTLKNTALIHQSGGGTGFNFSALRPNGDFISPNSGGSSGPISFMKIFDAATENIKQGGKRRGANMGILNIDHPDIEKFINSKKNETELQNFNISVGIFDEFMKAVINDSQYELKHPSSRKIIKKIKARELWGQITFNAWNSGDPGIIFLDTINKSNPTPNIGKIISTNPCGEVPLLPYEACNLGSIDVSRFYKKKGKQIDWKALEKTIHISIRFLDNVIEMNDYILPEIKSMVTGNRKIGLGIMGWANLLIRLEIPYASNSAIRLAEKLMKFINKKSTEASTKLAIERGVFKNWENSIYYPDKPMRNATRTSIAPTGTISIIADTSSSIEPIFALSITKKNVLNNETLSEVNELCIEYLKSNNINTKKIIKSIKETGSISHTALSIKDKLLFKTSLEIESIWHLKHQIAFQKHTDNAVSKTINLPENALASDIDKTFIQAWKQKAKGITVYRYGSKKKQILHKGLIDVNKTCKVCSE